MFIDDILSVVTGPARTEMKTERSIHRGEGERERPLSPFATEGSSSELLRRPQLRSADLPGVFASLHATVRRSADLRRLIGLTGFAT